MDYRRLFSRYRITRREIICCTTSVAIEVALNVAETVTKPKTPQKYPNQVAGRQPRPLAGR